MFENYQLSVINLYQCDPGFTTEKRNFDYHYFLYVHKGKGAFQIGSKKYKGVMGDLFYCPPLTDNTIIADIDNPFLLSGIEFSVNNNLTPLEIYPYNNILHCDFLVQCINMMIHQYTYRKNYSQDICDGILITIIKYMFQQMSSMSKSNQDNNVSSKILDYIVLNYNKNITHDTLSQIFNYHKNSINRYIVKRTGLSLKNYQIELRIKKAIELLKYSDKSISEIAEICGYNNSSFFSKQFKQKTSFNPISLRLKNNK